MGNFPGISQAEPLVGLLYLPAVLDLLLEQAKFVTNAVTDGWNGQGGKRVQIAGSQAAQTAVAESGLRLMIQEGIDALAEFGQCSRNRLANVVYVQQIVAELRADQEFCREVTDDSGARTSYP